jgi:hypothetical protein
MLPLGRQLPKQRLLGSERLFSCWSRCELCWQLTQRFKFIPIFASYHFFYKAIWYLRLITEKEVQIELLSIIEILLIPPEMEFRGLS